MEDQRTSGLLVEMVKTRKVSGRKGSKGRHGRKGTRKMRGGMNMKSYLLKATNAARSLKNQAVTKSKNLA